MPILSAASPFPHLMAPIRVGEHLLPNRALMGAMHTRLELLDRVDERLAAFYVARVRAGVGLVVTGAISPDVSGRIDEHSPVLCTEGQARKLTPLVDAIHAEGGKVLLQILHAGRYARIAQPLGASDIPSRINRRAPRAMTGEEVWRVVDAFVRCAELASLAGFDGVEIMGSEGYLINQFTAVRTNSRDDEWGGSAERRRRLPVEIVRRTRERLGPKCLLMYRISAVDLVEGGATAAETESLAREIEGAGADILNTGVGWHESTVPTIAYFVPRGAWSFASSRIKQAVTIPVVASNRINTPHLAEALIAGGQADMVSMARPFLADPEFMRKAATGRPDEINTCIACNQGCLDYIFADKPATCLVNPLAGRELDFAEMPPPGTARRVAVVGAGVAGLAFAVAAAERGHRITLFEAQGSVGGQVNLARRVPRKHEFDELLRYFQRRIEVLGVDLRLNTAPSGAELAGAGYDKIVVATGVRPRTPRIEGIRHDKVVSYADLLSARKIAGRRVAIIGAGGIGFDVAEFLLRQDAPEQAQDARSAFDDEWGVDPAQWNAGGVRPTAEMRPVREVLLLQRKKEMLGKGLGISTGWALRASLQRAGVQMLSGCHYQRIDEAGLHLTVDGEPRVVKADTIVLCAGQESERSLYEQLRELGARPDLIGGADVASELDALRAIDAGTRLAWSF